MSDVRNNRLFILLSLLDIVASLCVWLKYLYYYNPYHGAFDLLLLIPINVVGILSSLQVKRQGLKITFIIIQVLLGLSFLLPWLWWLVLEG